MAAKDENTTFHITFLRHGESTGNVAGLLQGQSDYPLTEKGVRQAQALAEQWRSANVIFDWVITSPLQRALQTAEIVAAPLGIVPICDPAWMEQSFGDLECMPVAEIDLSRPPFHIYHPYQPVGQNAESQMDLYRRASLAVQTLLSGAPGRYLVVSHGACLNMIVYAALGLVPNGIHSPRFAFGNTAYVQFEYRPAQHRWRMLSFQQASGVDENG